MVLGGRSYTEAVGCRAAVRAARGGRAISRDLATTHAGARSQGGTAIDPGRLPPFPPLRAFRTKKAYHLALFPNTFFSLYPDAFFRVVLSPKSVGKTVEHATLLTHKAALDAPNSKFISAPHAAARGWFGDSEIALFYEQERAICV